MSDIKPCPFPHCGNDKPFIVGGRNNRCVCCGSHKCQVTGPVCDSDELAVELWNAAPRRGDVPVAVAVEETLHDKYVRAALTGLKSGEYDSFADMVHDARGIADAAMKARKT